MRLTFTIETVEPVEAFPPPSPPKYWGGSPEQSPAMPPQEVPEWVDPKKLDPATLGLILELVKMGFELLAKWLAKRRERKG